MPYSAATTEIGKAILEYSETIDPPFHIFNDQKRVLFMKIGEEDNDDPLVGFIMYHKIGTPWPEGCFNFPTPPAVEIGTDGFSSTGFEIPYDASADFDWKTVVDEALERLKKEIADHE